MTNTNTQQLALEAIAVMSTDGVTNWEQLAILCITIARVEVASDFDSMLAAIQTTNDLLSEGAL